MAKYDTPSDIRPLEKLILDFSYANGYDPLNVFNDFLTYIIHGFSPVLPRFTAGNTNGSRMPHSWKW